MLSFIWLITDQYINSIMSGSSRAQYSGTTKTASLLRSHPSFVPSSPGRKVRWFIILLN